VVAVRPVTGGPAGGPAVGPGDTGLHTFGDLVGHRRGLVAGPLGHPPPRPVHPGLHPRVLPDLLARRADLLELLPAGARAEQVADPEACDERALAHGVTFPIGCWAHLTAARRQAPAVAPGH